jgi:hypothetical protein
MAGYSLVNHNLQFGLIVQILFYKEKQTNNATKDMANVIVLDCVEKLLTLNKINERILRH